MNWHINRILQRANQLISSFRLQQARHVLNRNHVRTGTLQLPSEVYVIITRVLLTR